MSEGASSVETAKKPVSREDRDVRLKRLLMLLGIGLLAVLIVWYGLNIGWAVVIIVGAIIAKMTGAA